MASSATSASPAFLARSGPTAVLLHRIDLLHPSRPCLLALAHVLAQATAMAVSERGADTCVQPSWSFRMRLRSSSATPCPGPKGARIPFQTRKGPGSLGHSKGGEREEEAHRNENGAVYGDGRRVSRGGWNMRAHHGCKESFFRGMEERKDRKTCCFPVLPTTTSPFEVAGPRAAMQPQDTPKDHLHVHSILEAQLQERSTASVIRHFANGVPTNGGMGVAVTRK